MNEILIIIFLILLNGLFSMSEIAVISARKSSLASEEKKGSKAATTALKLACQPEKFLSTVQIGITLIGILTGIYSGATLSEDFGKLLLEWHVPAVYARPLAQTIIVILVTYFTIIFGELVPKRIGMSSAERISKFIAPFMYFISVIAAPFVWILAKSTTAIFSLLGIKDGGSRVTEDEIKSIIQEGAEDGEVQEVEQDIMERALILGDLKVNALMTYRADMVALDVSMGREEVKAVVRDTVHEMYPVVDRSFDDVKGVVSLKSLVFHLDDENFDFHSVIVPATFFPRDHECIRCTCADEGKTHQSGSDLRRVRLLSGNHHIEGYSRRIGRFDRKPSRRTRYREAGRFGKLVGRRTLFVL